MRTSLGRGVGVGLALVLIGAIGCGSDSGTLQPRPRTTPRASVPTQTIETVEEVEPVAETEDRFEWTAVVDPFQPVRIEIGLGEEGDTCGLICTYDLSQLELRGVIWDINRPRALVEDGSGVGFIVAKGDRIGKNLGNVINITPNRLEVLEKYIGPVSVVPKKVVLKLHEEEDESDER